MSNKVQDFIDLWKEKNSLRTLMASDITDFEIDELRSELTKMDPEERKEAEEILKEVSNKLVKRIEKLKENQETLDKEMKRSKETKKACLAYQKQGQLSSTHKEEKAENTAHKIAKIREREERVRDNLKINKKTKTD